MRYSFENGLHPLHSLKRMESGVLIRQFDFQKGLGTRAPFAQLWGATLKVTDAIAAAKAKAVELEASRDFTASGRTNARRDYLRTTARPVLKEALETIQLADQEIVRLRSGMKGPAIDKTDIAAALRRQEIRSYLRTLPGSKRNAMVAMPDQVDPDIAAAIIEMPGELSGVSQAQHERLLERAIGAAYPAEFEAIDNTLAAVETLHDHIHWATTVFSSQGLAEHELLDKPSYSAELLARLTPLPENDDAKKPPAKSGLPGSPSSTPARSRPRSRLSNEVLAARLAAPPAADDHAA